MMDSAPESGRGVALLAIFALRSGQILVARWLLRSWAPLPDSSRISAARFFMGWRRDVSWFPDGHLALKLRP